MGFLKLSIGYKRRINIIASATFGVYLIYDNYHVRDFLWKTLFKNASFSESSLLIPYSIIAVILVFAVCTIIELLRIYLLERQYIPILNKMADTINQQCIEKFFRSVFLIICNDSLTVRIVV